MKPGTIIHTAAVLLSSLASLFSPASAAQAPVEKSKLSKKSVDPTPTASSGGPMVYTPTTRTLDMPAAPYRLFDWKKDIVTTVFWIGEKPTENNPVPNKASSWDAHWTSSYGGYDDPDPARRRNMLPSNFTPRQNPFYCALPYNDKARTGHRAEAPQVVPWFKEAYQGPAVSTCKGRWIAIRKGSRTVYAQWEDAGPFRTDHWQYVFGNERPKPNLNRGVGLDVSPAVRDYLGMQDTDVTDWKFVEFKDVPPGPWAKLGDNNTFVINSRSGSSSLVQGKKASAEITPQ